MRGDKAKEAKVSRADHGDEHIFLFWHCRKGCSFL